MSSTHKSGSFGAITVVLALVLAVSAAALVGCGGTVESPGGPSGTGQTEEQESLAVPEGETAAINAALTEAGIGGDPLYRYINYQSAAKDMVVVTGQLKNSDGAALSKVTLTKSGDAWAVASTQ